MLLVDTNALVDVLENDADWADWSIRQLRAQSPVHDLAINPIIYSELSLAFESVTALDDTLDVLEIAVAEIPRPALFPASRAFVKYRTSGGTKSNVPPDFFTGAHAAVLGCSILTRAARRYAQHFKTVPLIIPEPWYRAQTVCREVVLTRSIKKRRPARLPVFFMFNNLAK